MLCLYTLKCCPEIFPAPSSFKFKPINMRFINTENKTLKNKMGEIMSDDQTFQKYTLEPVTFVQF